MPLGSKPGTLRWQTGRKPRYAARVGKKKWEKHENAIRSLHAEGRTRNEIIETLDVEHGFRPTYGQLRKWSDRWLPKATRSAHSESGESSLKSCLSSLGSQLHLLGPASKSDACLTPDEERVFKTFTSILDEEPAECEQSSRWKRTSAGDQSQAEKEHLKRNAAATGRQQGISASHADSAPSIKRTAEQTTYDESLMPDILEIDSDEEEGRDVGPMWTNRCSASTDSKEFEELSTRLCRQERKRRPCYYHPDLVVEGARVYKKIQKRNRGACCECGKILRSRKCKECHHRACSGCRQVASSQLPATPG